MLHFFVNKSKLIGVRFTRKIYFSLSTFKFYILNSVLLCHFFVSICEIDLFSITHHILYVKKKYGEKFRQYMFTVIL